MKDIFKILVVVISILTIYSCGSGVDSSLAPKDRIEGEWVITQAEGSMSEMNMGTIYTFENGIMTTGGAATGKYTATDSTIVWDLISMEMNYNFHFEDNVLVLELNSGQALYLEKQ